MTTAKQKESPAYSAPENATDSSTEIVKANGFTADELRGITSFDDVNKLFADHEIKVVDAAEEIGDGFMLVDNDDKSKFERVEMMVLSWSFAEGDHTREDGTKSEFVAMRFVTREHNGSIGKYVVTDGGTGIYKQLREYTNRTGSTGGLYVKRGFRVSRYANEYRDNNETVYLDLSK